MDFETTSVKFSEIKKDALLADLYSKVYTIPKPERVKVLMSWLANAYSDLQIPFLAHTEALSSYTVHVRLLDTFANNSSYEVVAQLTSEFSENFLSLQVIPNLLENYEKTADITYYIQILCENLTCPSLIRKVIDVVTSTLTPILIGRMLSENHLVSTSTLSLLKSLLEFYCEDLWYELILQYLLPMRHLLTSQRQKMLPEIEFRESTEKLLELIPNHVTNLVSSSTIAEHFLEYHREELLRIRSVDAAIASSLPSSASQLRKVGLRSQDSEDGLVDPTELRKTGKNPTYPMWIFKYDGTDILLALRKSFVEEPEEFFEDDLFSSTNQLDSSPIPFSNIPENTDSQLEAEELSQSRLSNNEINFEFGTVSAVEQTTTFDSLVDTSLGYLGTESVNGGSPQTKDNSLASHGFTVKDKRNSIESFFEGGDLGGLYFGPFMNSLYTILRKWSSFHPDVLFTATEIMSVLASSRIPLVNALFLDMTLTLQPSYPSFPSLLHKVRRDLDSRMQTYPDYIFRNVWKSAGRECEASSSDQSSSREDDSSPSSFVDTLKRTIAANRSFRMAAGEMDRTVRVSRRSSFRAFSSIFKSSRESGRTSEFRLLSKPTSPFNDEDEEETAKTMALRSVLFTHWLLELGAIALHLCWGRKLFHGTPQGTLADALAARRNEGNTENANSSGASEETMNST